MRQVSRVQGTPSPHALGVPPTQLPPLQKSLRVQLLPSWQEPLALVLMQAPVAGSHESIVQVLPSLQSTGGWLHCPVAGSQRSRVQRSASSQSFEAPRQTMDPSGAAWQVSPVVQALPSSQ